MSLFQNILRNSQAMLMISLGLSFLLVGTTEAHYFASKFFPSVGISDTPAYVVGIMFAICIQFARFAFVSAGAADMQRGKQGAAAGGVLFSVLLAIWASYELYYIMLSHGLSGAPFMSSMLIMQCLVWLGFVLEVRLLMSAGRQHPVAPDLVEVDLSENRQFSANSGENRRVSAPDNTGKSYRSRADFEANKSAVLYAYSKHIEQTGQRPTQADLADATGLSTRTVSRVLKDANLSR